MHADSPDPPVSHWFNLLKQGNTAAMEGLWRYYEPRLMELARMRLRWASKTVADEDDLVVSVFQSLWKGTQDGRFSSLLHRHELWAMLAHITWQKAIDRDRKEKTKKRGEGRKHEELVADEIRELRPSPEMEAELKDELKHLMELLPDEMHRLVALRMQGYLNEEIAAELGVAIRTVERRLRTVRKIWGESLNQS